MAKLEAFPRVLTLVLSLALMGPGVGCGDDDTAGEGEGEGEGEGCATDAECPDSSYCYKLDVALPRGVCAQGCRTEPNNCDGGRICDPVSRLCQEVEQPCTQDTDCEDAATYCDVASGDCVAGCRGDGDCEELEFCELADHSCQPRPMICGAGIDDPKCPDGSWCDTSSPLGECKPGCEDYTDCPGSRPFCIEHRCMVCEDCPDPCNDASAVPSERCPGGFFCDDVTHVCNPTCNSDAECGDGDVCCTEDLCDQQRCVQRCEEEGPFACPPGWFCEPGGHCSPGCLNDEACGRASLICEANECRDGCRSDEICRAGTYCDLEQLICVAGECRQETEAEDCEAWEICNEQHQCQDRPCQADGDCFEGYYCNQAANLCALGCRADADCPGDVAICSDAHQCVDGCVDDGSCDPGTICSPDTHRCAAGCRDDELEPNDEPETFTALEIEDDGSLAAGEVLLCGRNPDWFGFDLAARDMVNLTIEYDAGGGTLGLEAVDSDGGLLARSIQAGQQRQSIQIGPVAAAVSVRVRVWAVDLPANRAVSYTLTGTRRHVEACVADAFEPNGERRTATALQDGLLEGLTLCDADEDWLSFPLGLGDSVQVSVLFDPSGPPLRAELWVMGRFELELLQTGVAPDGEPGVRRVAIPEVFEPDVYYLKVYPVAPTMEGIAYSVDLAPVRAIPPCDDDASEDNDERIDATVLGGPFVDEVFTDLMLCSDDDDWYRVDGRRGETLRVNLQHTWEQGDLNVELYRRGAMLQRANFERDVELLLYEIPEDDQYYLRVYGETAMDQNSYELRIRLQLEDCLQDRREPNDDADMATSLGCRERLNDLVACFEDDDWFELRTFQFGAIRAALDFDPAFGDLDLELVDRLGNTLTLQGEWVNGRKVAEAHLLEPDTYFAHVYALRGRPNRYAINLECEQEDPPCLPDLFEPNNSSEAAAPLRLPSGGPAGVIVNDLGVCSLDDEDWFQFRVSAGGWVNLTAQFFHFTGDLDLELFCYGDFEAPVAVGDTTNDDERIVYLAEHDGICYLRIFGQPQQVDGTDYDLILEPTDVEPVVNERPEE